MLVMDAARFSELSKELLSAPSRTSAGRVLRKLGSDLRCVESFDKLRVEDKDVDGGALKEVPGNCPGGLRPVKTNGDGNCLFRAMSVFVDGGSKGRDSLHFSLRLRTACELLMHSRFYAKALMQWAAKRGDYSGSLLSTVFSDAAMEKMTSARSVEDVEKAVVVDAQKTCINGAYSSMLTIHALATVCKVKVRSFFPEKRDTAALRPFFDCTIFPRADSLGNDGCAGSSKDVPVANVLWCRSAPPPLGSPWQPNHFVPLLHSQPLAKKVDDSTCKKPARGNALLWDWVQKAHKNKHQQPSPPSVKGKVPTKPQQPSASKQAPRCSSTPSPDRAPTFSRQAQSTQPSPGPSTHDKDTVSSSKCSLQPTRSPSSPGIGPTSTSTQGKGSGRKTPGRAFQDDWKKGRPWLATKEDNKIMFCLWCAEHEKNNAEKNSFVCGTSTMKKETVVFHERSKSHLHAQFAHEKMLVRAEAKEPSSVPGSIERGLSTMKSAELATLKKLFRTALYLALNERPFSDFKPLLELQEKNGAELANIYRNDKQAHAFTHAIAESVRADVRAALRDSPFVSVLCDSSTDKATIEEEIVQVRLLVDNRPKFQFLDFRPLRRANAENICTAVTMSLQSYCPNWKEKLVAFGADGAPVNLGCNNGAAVKIKELCPHLVPVHGCAHRLELAVKDGAKKCRIMNIIDDILENAFKMYHKSPLCWQELQETGKTMNLPQKKPTKLKGTRWVAHRQRALAVVLESWPVVVEHTGQVLLGKTSMRGRATKLHKLLILPDVVLSMYLINDMLTVLSRLSCALQQKDATIHTLLRSLRSVRFELERMCRPDRLKARVSAVLAETEITSTNAEALRIRPAKSDSDDDDESDDSSSEVESDASDLEPLGSDEDEDGDDTEELVEGSREAIWHRGKRLRQPARSREQLVDSVSHTFRALVEGMMQHLNLRFSSFEGSDVVAAFKVFCPSTWPEGSELVDYGEEEVVRLAEHFRTPMVKQGLDPSLCVIEWGELKLEVMDWVQRRGTAKKVRFLDMWQNILSSQTSNNLGNILALVKIMLVLPIHTAELERNFSLAGRVKTDWRNRLHSTTVSDLMMLSLSSLSVDSFQAERAIELWTLSSNRKRRSHAPHGPQTKRKKNTA